MKIRVTSNLRILRALKYPDQNLTISGLATATGLPRGWLSRLEHGQVRVIKLDRVEILCNFFGVTPREIANLIEDTK